MIDAGAYEENLKKLLLFIAWYLLLLFCRKGSQCNLLSVTKTLKIA